MAKLHLVNKPKSHPAFQDFLLAVQAGDTVLLLNDGIYAALESIDYPAQVAIYLLESDLTGRGLTAQRQHLNPAFTIINYDGFVQLTEQHNPIISWY